MARYEVKTKDSIERRLEEADIERLFRQGIIQMDNPCKRTGSPNWFRLDEMFPKLKKSEEALVYRATVATGRSTFHSLIITALLLIALAVTLTLATQKLLQAEPGNPRTQNSP